MVVVVVVVVCLSVCLSVCPSVCLSVCVSVGRSATIFRVGCCMHPMLLFLLLLLLLLLLLICSAVLLPLPMHPMSAVLLSRSCRAAFPAHACYVSSAASPFPTVPCAVSICSAVLLPRSKSKTSHLNCTTPHSNRLKQQTCTIKTNHGNERNTLAQHLIATD